MSAEEDLRVRLYEPVSAAKHNALVDLTARNGWMSGSNVRINRSPYGSFIHFDAPTGSSSSPFFRVSVSTLGRLFQIRFERGMIGGVEPKIKGLAISKIGDDRKRPALVVGDESFDPDEDVAGIYFKCTVQHDTFAIVNIEPVAAPAKPAKEPWVAYKLAGFLIRTGKSVRYDRQLFSNLGFYAANRQSNGFFDPLWIWNS